MSRRALRTGGKGENVLLKECGKLSGKWEIIMCESKQKKHEGIFKVALWP